MEQRLPPEEPSRTRPTWTGLGPLLLLPFFIALAGCAEPTAPEPQPDRAAQQEACAATVADHIGRPTDAVRVRWTGADAEGRATIEARDNGRLHACTVEPTGRVLRIDHI